MMASSVIKSEFHQPNKSMQPTLERATDLAHSLNK